VELSKHLPAGPSDPVPKWWSKHQAQGFTSALAHWNCCGDPRNVEVDYWSTSVSGVLDCR
jgi:hypothetical protein